MSNVRNALVLSLWPMLALAISACGRTALLDDEPWSPASQASADGGHPNEASDSDNGDNADASSPPESGTQSPPDIDLATACLVKHNKVVFIGAYERHGDPFIDEAPSGKWPVNVVNSSPDQPSRIDVTESRWGATFASPTPDKPLLPGVYSDVTSPERPTGDRPQLSVWWRADPFCGGIDTKGRFEVIEIDTVPTKSNDPELKSFTATFEQQCLDLENTVYRGCVHLEQ